jgi:hypothetical protein
MKVAKYKIELELLREMLGTNPVDADIHDAHRIERERKLIQEKSKVNKALNKYADASDISEERKQAEIQKIKERAEELTESVGELDEKGITCFFRHEGKIAIGDHMIYGFMKAATEAIVRASPAKKGTILGSTAFTASIINQHIRCEEEFIIVADDIMRKEDGTSDYCVRSLRAMTAQGPRVTIAKSERIAGGSKIPFTLNVMDGSPLTQKDIETIFAYGEIVGLGQWRNSGKGRFKATVTKL